MERTEVPATSKRVCYLEYRLSIRRTDGDGAIRYSAAFIKSSAIVKSNAPE